MCARPDLGSKQMKKGQSLLVCNVSLSVPYPLKHICSLTNAHAARQPRRDPQCPSRERDVCCLTVCQQAQINSAASSPQSLSSLLLTSETFSHLRPCDLTFPESFTQPAMHFCVSKWAVTNTVTHSAELCCAMPAQIHTHT